MWKISARYSRTSPDGNYNIYNKNPKDRSMEDQTLQKRKKKESVILKDTVVATIAGQTTEKHSYRLSQELI